MSYINVQVNTRDLDSEDLIEIIEERGFRVMAPGQIDEDVESLHRQTDEIHNLYDAFLAWYQFGIKNETFEYQLKRFFEDTIDEKVL